MSVTRVDAAGSRSIALLLTGGVAVGCVLLAAGGVIAAFHGGLTPGLGVGSTGFADPSGLLHLDGTALIRAGILVLILTPVLRVAAVAVLLARRQDRGGVVYAIAVLLLVALATALDLRH